MVQLLFSCPVIIRREILYLGYTCGGTPADLLMASMAAAQCSPRADLTVFTSESTHYTQCGLNSQRLLFRHRL